MSILAFEDTTRLQGILAEHDATHCRCGHAIGFGDVAWNNADTEAGTPYSVVNIVCVACGTEIAHIVSWYPEIEDEHDLLRVLEKDWE